MAPRVWVPACYPRKALPTPGGTMPAAMPLTLLANLRDDLGVMGGECFWASLMILAAIGLCAVIARADSRRWRLTRGRLARGLCPACGYDLCRNASGVCPECGTAVRR